MNSKISNINKLKLKLKLILIEIQNKKYINQQKIGRFKKLNRL